MSNIQGVVSEVIDPRLPTTRSKKGSDAGLGDGAAYGVYVSIYTASDFAIGSAPRGRPAVSKWVQAHEIRDGAFSTVLTVPRGQLNPAEHYNVTTFAAHGLSMTDRSLDAAHALTFLAGNTDQGSGDPNTENPGGQTPPATTTKTPETNPANSPANSPSRAVTRQHLPGLRRIPLPLQ